MSFTIKAELLNQQGISPLVTKLENFSGFPGKNARRVSKVCKNIVAHWDVVMKTMQKEAKELGGTLVGRNFNFKDAESNEKFEAKVKEIMDSSIEMNCNKISYEEDIKPFEQAMKLTPLDYAILEPFCEGFPKD